MFYVLFSHFLINGHILITSCLTETLKYFYILPIPILVMGTKDNTEL